MSKLLYLELTRSTNRMVGVHCLGAEYIIMRIAHTVTKKKQKKHKRCLCQLTHSYMEILKWVIGKQCRPRSDATSCGI